MTGPRTGPLATGPGPRTGPVRLRDSAKISPVRWDRSGRTGGPVPLFGGLVDPEGTGDGRTVAALALGLSPLENSKTPPTVQRRDRDQGGHRSNRHDERCGSVADVMAATAFSRWSERSEVPARRATVEMISMVAGGCFASTESLAASVPGEAASLERRLERGHGRSSLEVARRSALAWGRQSSPVSSRVFVVRAVGGVA